MRFAQKAKIRWFHLGSDIQSSRSIVDLPLYASHRLETLSHAPSFLMVSTLEPRKGHQQVLNAFNLLWQKGMTVNLVIVGKQGWRVDKLAGMLRQHSQLNHCLFWLEGISDEYLEKIYQACDCLIAASEGEGFGLPLIEAAREGLAIIARDIPIFHEVTQDHAYFFSGKAPEILAETILSWLTLFQCNQHPRSDAISWLTWRQSAEQLLKIILTN